MSDNASRLRTLLSKNIELQCEVAKRIRSRKHEWDCLDAQLQALLQNTTAALVSNGCEHPLDVRTRGADVTFPFPTTPVIPWDADIDEALALAVDVCTARNSLAVDVCTARNSRWSDVVGVVEPMVARSAVEGQRRRVSELDCRLRLLNVIRCDRSLFTAAEDRIILDAVEGPGRKLTCSGRHIWRRVSESIAQHCSVQRSPFQCATRYQVVLRQDFCVDPSASAISTQNGDPIFTIINDAAQEVGAIREGEILLAANRNFVSSPLNPNSSEGPWIPFTKSIHDFIYRTLSGQLRRKRRRTSRHEIRCINDETLLSMMDFVCALLLVKHMNPVRENASVQPVELARMLFNMKGASIAAAPLDVPIENLMRNNPHSTPIVSIFHMRNGIDIAMHVEKQQRMRNEPSTMASELLEGTRSAKDKIRTYLSIKRKTVVWRWNAIEKLATDVFGSDARWIPETRALLLEHLRQEDAMKKCRRFPLSRVTFDLGPKRAANTEPTESDSTIDHLD